MKISHLAFALTLGALSGTALAQDGILLTKYADSGFVPPHLNAAQQCLISADGVEIVRSVGLVITTEMRNVTVPADQVIALVQKADAGKVQETQGPTDVPNTFWKGSLVTPEGGSRPVLLKQAGQLDAINQSPEAKQLVLLIDMLCGF